MVDCIIMAMSSAPADEDIQTLAKLLGSRRCRVKYQQDIRCLVINYETDVPRAGRKPKLALDTYTVAEVRRMLVDDTADRVASKLGISRATLYRRLRAKDDEDFI